MTDIDTVIGSGACVGCGACAVVRPDLYTIEMNVQGHLQAKRKPEGHESDPLLPRICPMSGVSQNENEIAAQLYPELPADSQIGRYRKTFAAHVNEGEFRSRGGSGGLISWIVAELFRSGKIDAVLHVKPADPTEGNGVLFHYAISSSEPEMMAGAKSRYYPVEMSRVLSEIKGSGKRYAIVGLPCFIKAIRTMQNEKLLSKEQIVYCLGLVCGHLKSRYFAEYLAWQKGAVPNSLATFDFRRKFENRRASDYGFAYSQLPPDLPNEKVWPMSSVQGRDWGEGMFKNAACEFCDDVLAECADVAIGDAWLPEYVFDPKGTNVVVTRDATIDSIIQEGAKRGLITLGKADVNAVIQSQASGLRHRREGLSHRLARRQEAGEWFPVKRVEPKFAPTKARQEIYDARMEIAATSSAIFAKVRNNSLQIDQFDMDIEPALLRYRSAQLKERPSAIYRLARKIINRVRQLLRQR